MSRSALAALLLLSTAGCGAPVAPKRSFFDGPSASDMLHLGLTAVAVAIVAYFLVARRGRPAGTIEAPRRALFLTVVLSVTTTGALGCIRVLHGEADYFATRVLVSAAAVGGSSFLLMRFLAALSERPTLRVARLGAGLAVLLLPLALVGIWAAIGADWLWKLVVTCAALAAIAAHATYLILLAVPPSQRWLVGATRALGVGVAGLVVAILWLPPPREGPLSWLGQALGTLGAATLTGTVLVEMCNARARMTTGRSAPVRHCIACGSTRIVTLTDSVRCEDCSAEFRVESCTAPGRRPDGDAARGGAP